MPTHTFVVGQKATVMHKEGSGATEAVSVVTVTRVMSRFIETGDGQKWDTEDHRTWPRSHRPRFSRLIIYLEPGGAEDVQLRVDGRDARREILERTQRWASSDKALASLSPEGALKILALWDADIAARKPAEPV